ncbi:MAG TPA: carboxypeptidase-like regulatory domain-containing protein [Polyangiales bacterium]
MALLVLSLRWHDSVRSSDSASTESGGIARLRSHGATGAVDARVTVLLGSVRSADGPVQKARVCLAPALAILPMNERAPCVVTESDGSYRFTSLPPGRYTVTATAAPYGTASADLGRPVLLHAGATVVADILLQGHGALLGGTVVDALGGAVAHAQLRLVHFLSDSHPTLEVEADDEGRFALWTASGQSVLTAQADGYAPTEVAVTAPSSGVEVVLTPGGSIAGQVVDLRTHEPVADVEVRAVAEGKNPLLALSARSNEDGEFEVHDLVPGVYRLTGESSNARGQSQGRVQLGLGSHLRDVLVMVEAAVPISGRVLHSQGDTPCEQGFVTLGPYSPELADFSHEALPAPAPDAPPVPTLYSAIDHEGKVSFQGATPGTYYAMVQCLDAVVQKGPSTLSVGREPLDDVLWQVEPGLGLSILVTDEANRPVPGASLLLEFPKHEGDSATAFMGLAADDNGRCEVPQNLRAGTYHILPGHGYEGESVALALRSGTGRSEVTLRLRGSASIVVEVMDDHGTALDQLRVSGRRLYSVAGAAEQAGEPATALASSEGMLAVPMGDGRYRLSPLPAGRYEVGVLDGTNPSVPSPVIEVGVGATATTRLRLARGSTLAGTVVNEDGAPAANVPVSATNDSAPSQLASLALEPKVAFTDAEGSFELTGLDPGGRFTVRAGHRAGLHAIQEGVALGTPVKLALSLHASNGRAALAPLPVQVDSAQ